ncbi:hypothetical protein [Microbacterium sp. MMO-113]|uniref:hypothetical protein n=1 Tax=Microbacterium sp. MMO-113 TaxID=3081273 RepID=UPI0030188B82
MSIPSSRIAVAAIGRAVRAGDPIAERSARSDLAAAKVDRAITDALSASGARLKPEHAAQLSARLQGGAK